MSLFKNILPRPSKELQIIEVHEAMKQLAKEYQDKFPLGGIIPLTVGDFSRFSLAPVLQELYEKEVRGFLASVGRNPMGDLKLSIVAVTGGKNDMKKIVYLTSGPEAMDVRLWADIGAEETWMDEHEEGATADYSLVEKHRFPDPQETALKMVAMVTEAMKVVRQD